MESVAWGRQWYPSQSCVLFLRLLQLVFFPCVGKISLNSVSRNLNFIFSHTATLPGDLGPEITFTSWGHWNNTCKISPLGVMCWEENCDTRMGTCQVWSRDKLWVSWEPSVKEVLSVLDEHGISTYMQVSCKCSQTLQKQIGGATQGISDTFGCSAFCGKMFGYVTGV